MKECGKRNRLIRIKLQMICISSNNDRHPVPKTFTPFHHTSTNYALLHFTTLVDTSLFPI